MTHQSVKHFATIATLYMYLLLLQLLGATKSLSRLKALTCDDVSENVLTQTHGERHCK